MQGSDAVPGILMNNEMDDKHNKFERMQGALQGKFQRSSFHRNSEKCCGC